MILLSFQIATLWTFRYNVVIQRFRQELGVWTQEFNCTIPTTMTFLRPSRGLTACSLVGLWADKPRWCWFVVRGKHGWLTDKPWLKPTSEHAVKLEETHPINLKGRNTGSTNPNRADLIRYGAGLGLVRRLGMRGPRPTTEAGRLGNGRLAAQVPSPLVPLHPPDPTQTSELPKRSFSPNLASHSPSRLAISVNVSFWVIVTHGLFSLLDQRGSPVFYIRKGWFGSAIASAIWFLLPSSKSSVFGHTKCCLISRFLRIMFTDTVVASTVCRTLCRAWRGEHQEVLIFSYYMENN